MKTSSASWLDSSQERHSTTKDHIAQEKWDLTLFRNLQAYCDLLCFFSFGFCNFQAWAGYTSSPMQVEMQQLIAWVAFRWNPNERSLIETSFAKVHPNVTGQLLWLSWPVVIKLQLCLYICLGHAKTQLGPNPTVTKIFTSLKHIQGSNWAIHLRFHPVCTCQRGGCAIWCLSPVWSWKTAETLAQTWVLRNAPWVPSIDINYLSMFFKTRW